MSRVTRYTVVGVESGKTPKAGPALGVRLRQKPRMAGSSARAPWRWGAAGDERLAGKGSEQEQGSWKLWGVSHAVHF